MTTADATPTPEPLDPGAFTVLLADVVERILDARTADLRADNARLRAQVVAVEALHPDMLGWCQTCAHESYPCRTRTALDAGGDRDA